MSDLIKQVSVIEVLLTTAFLILLFGAARWDVRERRIPDVIVIGVFITAVLRAVFLGIPGVPDCILGAFAVSVPMLLSAVAVPGAFGGGDIKLMAACGLFLGIEDVFFSFFYALVLGAAFSVYLLLCKNKTRKDGFAFGPFLTAGIWIRLAFCLFCC